MRKFASTHIFTKLPTHFETVVSSRVCGLSKFQSWERSESFGAKIIERGGSYGPTATNRSSECLYRTA